MRPAVGIALAAAILAAWAAPASAATPWVAVSGGFAMPSGDFARDVLPGPAIIGGLDVRVSPRWTVGPEIGWIRLRGTDELERDLRQFTGQDVEATYTLVPIQLVAKGMFLEGPRATPYLRAGFGVAMVGADFDGETFATRSSTGELDMSLGAGVLSPATDDVRAGAEIEIHFIDVGDELARMFTLRAVVRFGVGGR